ncbi:metallopeptidase family protein [Candidatus Dojkabacteria bacterium]|uniref:Possibl zinc metallo-peptidase n=2 Tax=Candidatus Dojkabacteria TaxID=74243 RepID=A0A136KEN6_9BACT|nr:MAG: Possibl zinc metallo-peptidase [candidate division WS6 bacterium OLB21]MBW7953290.1 metallopeptidase family protein [Candidatus Dojkabacteria bacterium]
MQLDQFEQYVQEGITRIPADFREHLENVSLVIEDFPTAHQFNKMRLKHKWQLFGLYEGVPLPKRTSSYSMVLPDKITLFRQPLVNYARDEEHLRQLVANVIWHEIAHYFGYTEEEVRKAESERGIVY